MLGLLSNACFRPPSRAPQQGGNVINTSLETLNLIRLALIEDHASADTTTRSLIDSSCLGNAVLTARASGIVGGLHIALSVFKELDMSLSCEALVQDGDAVCLGTSLGRINGSLSSILSAERTALNFLQRMSGVATETARYVSAIKGLPCRIFDTRKTVPTLRSLDKYAVRLGGGENHRKDLADGILIKDNHIEALTTQGATLGQVIRTCRSNIPDSMRIQVEVETVEHAREAIDAGAEILMLDNMSLADMRKVVSFTKGEAITEASGGISLETVRQVAETGVDMISVGALTHSARALDISLDIDAHTSYKENRSL